MPANQNWTTRTLSTNKQKKLIIPAPKTISQPALSSPAKLSSRPDTRHEVFHLTYGHHRSYPSGYGTNRDQLGIEIKILMTVAKITQ